MPIHLYIDGENVQDQWLIVVPYLSHGDIVHLFTSDAVTRKAQYGMVFPIEVINHYCRHTHKNAMDFQVVALAAFMCRKYPEREHYIISKDLGFDCACEVIPIHNLHRMSPTSFIEKVGTREEVPD